MKNKSVAPPKSGPLQPPLTNTSAFTVQIGSQKLLFDLVTTLTELKSQPGRIIPFHKGKRRRKPKAT
jgi:hypothetical protein